jgi:glycosyltransferase involved in cell wall biosynthesis
MRSTAPAERPRTSVLIAADPRLVNPYLRMIFAAESFRRRAEVRPVGSGLFAQGRNLHLHWVEYLLHGRLCRRSPRLTDAAYAALVRAIDRVRSRGGRIVWTAHNLAPHGFPSPHGEAAYRRWGPEILRRVDTVVAMSPAVARAVAAAVPETARARAVVIPHPHYRDQYRGAPDRQLARGLLGLARAGHLTCAIGLIRRYKRVPALIDSFVATALPDEHLLVAGPCDDPDLRAEVARAAARSDRVHLRIGPLSDADFAAAVRAADLFVANFGEVLNSGSVFAALSLATPVLAPRQGALGDLQTQIGDDWLRLFDGALDAPALRGFVDASRANVPAGEPDLAANDPETVIAAHLALYT